MKERKCGSCQTINQLEYTLRTNNLSTITIRCKNCKLLLRVKNENKSLQTDAV